MRLTKILTPELIQGSRGRDEDIRAYRDLLNQIHKVGPGIQTSNPWLMQDEVLCSFFGLCWKWKHGPGQVYHVGRGFAEAMAGVEKDIPYDLLPERFFAYFSFPEGTFVGIEDMPVRGGFIFIGPPSETSARTVSYKKVVWINYETDVPPEQLKPDEMQWRTVNLLMPLDYGTKHALTDVPQIPGSQLTTEVVHRAFINLAVYIHSLNAEILPARPVQQQTNSQRKAFYAKHGVANLCTVPVTFVSWNYKTPVNYRVDSTTVQAHFRWQRCGPGFTQVKLILIDEHERHYRRSHGQETDQGRVIGVQDGKSGEE